MSVPTTVFMNLQGLDVKIAATISVQLVKALGLEDQTTIQNTDRKVGIYRVSGCSRGQYRVEIAGRMTQN